MPGADRIRVALIGYGLAGAVFHAPLIAATPGMEVATVVTSDPDRRVRAQRDHPGARILDRVDQLWDAPRHHDLAVVATANRAHVPVARAALEAGLAVVVEKPMAATSGEAWTLVEQAERASLLLTVFHNRRWDGDFLTVRRLVSEGVLGTVTRFESRFERWQPRPRAGAWRMRGAPEEGGGLLLDLGSHLVDQAVLLFGPPLHVSGELDHRREGVEVDDDVFVALEHAGGVRSHLWASAVAALPGPRFRVLGKRGAFVKDGLDGQEAALRAGRRPGGARWAREPRRGWGRLSTGEDARPVEPEPGDWPRFYALVAAALRTGAPPPVDPREAAAVIEVLEAVRAADAARRGGVDRHS